MTDLDTTATVTTAPMTQAEATRLVTKTDLRLGTIVQNWEAVVPMMRELLEREAHVALGYASAGALFKDKFGSKLARLVPELRRELVNELSVQGLSTRALAPVFDVNQATIVRDLRAGDADASPGTVIGIDGKNYQTRQVRTTAAGELAEFEAGLAQRESPTKYVDNAEQDGPVGAATSRRRPDITKRFLNLAVDLRRLQTSLQNLHDDDRYSKHKDDQRGLQFAVRQMLQLLTELEAEFPSEAHLD